jgi:acyl-CoA hydrolase
MEVGVKLVAERWDSAESEPVTVATAYLVFVAIDVDGKPRPVPPVIPGDVDDERRFREALIRRQHRLDRRAAIQQARAETARGETARGETARGETARGETARGEAGRDATGGETGGTRAE